MPRIKINDLPRDKKISEEEMRKVSGGALWVSRNDGSMTDRLVNQRGTAPLLPSGGDSPRVATCFF